MVDGVWSTWNQTYQITMTANSTTSCTGNDLIWQQWAQDWTGNVTATTTQVRVMANQARALQEHLRQRQPVPSAEDWQELAKKEAERRRQAEARAEELLLSLLSDEQERSYKQRRHFDVISDRERRFRIHANGVAGNIQMLRSLTVDQPVAVLCCHPPGKLPHQDVWAAQKLAIETDETDFCRRANVSSLVTNGASLVRPPRSTDREAIEYRVA